MVGTAIFKNYSKTIMKIYEIIHLHLKLFNLYFCLALFLYVQYACMYMLTCRHTKHKHHTKYQKTEHGATVIDDTKTATSAKCGSSVIITWIWNTSIGTGD